jgi:transcription-repair coupling factor (superfamily II helicase)
LYKRIANAADNNTLRELQIELIDRFGLLPQQVKNLFAIAELKQSCIRLGICKIEAGTTGGRIVFDPATKISPTKIIEMVQQRPTELRFVDGNTLRITKNWTDAAIRLKEVQAMINELLIV